MSVTRSSKSKNTGINSLNNPAILALQEIKDRKEEVIHIAITPRTTIELSASLSPEEREVRIANYKKLHGSKI